MNQVSVEPWSRLARHSEPGSVTIVCPLEPENPDRDLIRLRLRHQVEQAESMLTKAGIEPDIQRVMLSPLHPMATDVLSVPREGETLFAFLSPTKSEVLQLDIKATARVSVASHFHVRPLLGDGRTPTRLFILSLSDAGARLLRSDCFGTTEVDLPLSRENRDAANGERVRPDGSGSQSAHGTAGGPKAQTQGFGHEQHDDIERDVWYRVVVDALTEALPSRQECLVVVTDRVHQGAFAERCEAASIDAITVAHNPSGLSDAELAKLARPEVVRHGRPDPEQLGAQWAAAMNDGRCLLSSVQIAQRAAEGRIHTVFFDPDAAVAARPGDGMWEVVPAGESGTIDLVNEVVLATLEHGGETVPVRPGTLTRITGNADCSVAAIARW